MKKLSLRMRLTLIVLIVITVIAVMMTLLAMYNAKIMSNSAIENIILYMDVPASEHLDNNSTQFSISDEGEDVGLTITGQVNESDSSILELHDILESGEIDSMPENLEGIPEMESVVAAFDTSQNRFDYNSIIFMLIIIAAGGIITFFALGRGLKPVRQLSDEIEGITENELNVRVSDFGTKDEISRLADSFNTLMERLEKAFTEQKNFSTSAAHELKTPIAAIKSNIDVLELDTDPTNAEYAQTISVVKKQTERMMNLVDDLFSFSSGDYDIADTVNLTDILENIIEDYSSSALEKKIDINVEFNVENLIKTNQSILQRILSNLIENAVNYTEQNGEIYITTDEDNTGYFIRIMDNGIGISTEYEEQIFQPFFRVDESRSRKAGGAGLGLAIAKSMAEKIGATISVSANVPKGSIFTLHMIKD